LLSLLGLTSCVVGANWFVGHVGTPTPSGPHVVPVGFGLQAPSGVLLVGLALLLRDVLHRSAGARAVGVAIVVGAALSAWVAPASLAVASAVTFLVAESIDALVYQRARLRGDSFGMLLSNVVGSAVDTVLFLVLAFGTSSLRVFGWPQFVGKMEATIVGVVLLALLAGRFRVRRPTSV
jgi:uncharacterized PurR-regulated membrane protein YhhQ (DUF165 family)